MNRMQIDRRWEGTITGTEVVLPLHLGGVPLHLRPGAARLAPGSGLEGEQRTPTVPHVHVHSTPRKTMAVKFVGSNGSVQLQACDGDPRMAGAHWYNVGDPVAADGTRIDNELRHFVRVFVTDAGDGGVRVYLTATNA